MLISLLGVHGEVPIKTDPQVAYRFVRHKYMTSSHADGCEVEGT